MFNLLSSLPLYSVLTTKIIAKLINKQSSQSIFEATSRKIKNSDLNFPLLVPDMLVDEHNRAAKKLVLRQLVENARKKRAT